MAEERQIEFFYSDDLDSPVLRLRHIAELKKHGLDIKVKIEGAEKSYFTKLKELVRTAKGDIYLMMQELQPKDGNEKLKISPEVLFEYSDAVGRFQFKTTFIGHEGPNLKFSVPEKIERIRGRAYYRVRPSQKDPVEVTLTTVTGRQFRGKILDISEGGFAMSAHASPEALPHGQEVEVYFGLPRREGERPENWYKIRAPAVIKFIGPWEGSLYKIGLEFRGLSETDKRIVINYVLMRQREEIRRMREFE